MDRIQLGPPPSRPWPLNRLEPSFPIPQSQPPARWQAILGVVATGCAVLCFLAIHFGHAVIPPKALGPHEAVGTAVFVNGSGHNVLASYTPRGDFDAGGLAIGYVNGVVAVGQSVVVRYNSTQSTTGTVVSQSPARSRPNGLYGTFVVTTALALGLSGWAVSVRRRWRRMQAREDATDYRMDFWAGTTNSA